MSIELLEELKAKQDELIKNIQALIKEFDKDKIFNDEIKKIKRERVE